MACFAVEALLVLGLLLASFAAQGAFVISIGNAVLRAAHLTGYPRHGLAAAVGAIGGPIAFTLACVVQNAMVKILTPLCGRIPRPNEEQNSGERDGAPWYWACIQFFSPIAIHTLSGSVGSAILLHRRVDLEGMDVLHGARAGATGDAIIAFSSLLGPFIIFTIFAVLLAPVWIAMIMGAKWVYIKSRETWTEGTHTYSACHCYGTCGGDSEIDGEIESVQRERGSYGTF
ncbi:unnamed protein product [Cyclocybe aegerita]|uniref:Uncharacterized protein n=1 Tax=Cyclocybe aegerita TaxID=1973307 RepID=A0A8S0W4I7_CYCAE|nr:unnamed protein product [Cyclocybe aegerita]